MWPAGTLRRDGVAAFVIWRRGIRRVRMQTALDASVDTEARSLPGNRAIRRLLTHPAETGATVLVITLLTGCRTAIVSANSSRVRTIDSPRGGAAGESPPRDAVLAESATKKMEIAKRGYDTAWALSSRSWPPDVANESRWARRWLESVCDVTSTTAERVCAFELYKERVATIADHLELRKDFDVSAKKLLEAQYVHYEAELWLARSRIAEMDPFKPATLGGEVDSVLSRLARRKFEIVQRGYQEVERGAERATISDQSNWAWRWLSSQLDIAGSEAERIGAIELYRDRISKRAQHSRAAVQFGGMSVMDLLDVEYLEAGAELLLARCRLEQAKRLEGRATEEDTGTALSQVAAKKLEIARWGYERTGMRHQRRDVLCLLDEASWARRWLESQLDVATTDAERLAAFELYRERVAKLGQYAEARRNFDLTSYQLLEFEYLRAEAEYLLARCQTGDIEPLEPAPHGAEE